MTFSITYLQVGQLKRVVRSIYAPTDAHQKVGGPHPYVDPAPEKVGGQLTPWTTWLRGPWYIYVRSKAGEMASLIQRTA